MIDLFAGCGGMSLGFQKAGFHSLMAVEHDLHAAATYAANFGEADVLQKDIALIPDEEIPEADLVIGGPPCQGFSNLGSKDVTDPRNKLWKEYLRFVDKAAPKAFVLENVARFRLSSEFALLLEEADHGMLKDYELRHAVLVASDFGVAQRRPRAIVIGTRRDLPPISHPTSTHARVPGLDLQPWQTVQSRIEGLPRVPATTDLPLKKPVQHFEQAVPGYFSGLDLHIGRRPMARSLERYNHIPPGGGRFDLPDHLLSDCWRNKPAGTTDVMGRMRWDAPSPTIRTEFFKPEKGRYLHPQWNPDEPEDRVNRVITHFEASLLQDFPRDYRWCGTKVSIARQIGNAVPVGLAEAVGHHIRRSLGS